MFDPCNGKMAAVNGSANRSIFAVDYLLCQVRSVRAKFMTWFDCFNVVGLDRDPDSGHRGYSAGAFFGSSFDRLGLLALLMTGFLLQMLTAAFD